MLISPQRTFLASTSQIFLGEVNDREWGLMIRMARAIQADEQQQKHCFVCQSPNHFARNCPQAKNV